jgi:hypothetical protein
MNQSQTAPAGRAKDPIHNEPWSVWDMLELKAGAFVEAAFELAGLASFISGTSLSTGDNDIIFHEDKQLNDGDRGWLQPRL